MRVWILLLVALGLFWMMRTREHYVEVPGPGARPSLNDAAWRSKIDAQAPIGASDDDYVAALQKFYDTVYIVKRPAGSTSSPKDTDVQAFLDSNTFPNVSKDALRQIILSGFSIDKTESAAAREQKQVKFQPTEALQPRDGVDQVYAHNTQELYLPADSRMGQLPEGVYQATPQTEPKRPAWSSTAFASVCECAQNVL